MFYCTVCLCCTYRRLQHLLHLHLRPLWPRRVWYTPHYWVRSWGPDDLPAVWCLLPSRRKLQLQQKGGKQKSVILMIWNDDAFPPPDSDFSEMAAGNIFLFLCECWQPVGGHHTVVDLWLLLWGTESRRSSPSSSSSSLSLSLRLGCSLIRLLCWVSWRAGSLTPSSSEDW